MTTHEESAKEPPEDLTDLGLKLIDEVATNLWGRDLRNASDCARAICLPITKYVDAVLKLREKQNENT